jgi:hypothetical protein
MAFFDGYSNSGGMKIYCPELEIECETPGYSIFEKWKWFGTVSWITLGLSLAFGPQWIFDVWVIMSSLVVVLLCVRKAQWHALEHKLTLILENEEDQFFMDRFKKATKESEDCGSGNQFLLPPPLSLLRVGEKMFLEARKKEKEERR